MTDATVLGCRPAAPAATTPPSAAIPHASLLPASGPGGGRRRGAGPRRRHLAEEGSGHPRLHRLDPQSQSYGALVWRRLRRSVPGMLGLVLVTLLLLIGAVFADFVAPRGPQGAQRGLRAARQDLVVRPRARARGAGWRLLPVAFPIVEGEEFDPGHLPAASRAPTTPTPAPSSSSRRAGSTGSSASAMNRHLFGTADGSPFHLLGTDSFGRDILSRGIVGSRISLAIALVSIALITIIGTLAGITSGYIGGRLRRLVPALRGDHPRLPAAAPLPDARHADPGHGAVGAVPDLRGPRHRGPRLGAALARGAVQDAGAAAGGLRARGPRGGGARTGGSSRGTSCPT